MRGPLKRWIWATEFVLLALLFPSQVRGEEPNASLNFLTTPSFTFLQRRAESGDVWAMYLLAEKVQRLPGDSTEAKQVAQRWLSEAAKSGFAPAMTALADLAATTSPANFEEAKELYQNAARQGYGPAMSNLGALYYNNGNYVEAKQWFEAAIKVGFPGGMMNLAVMYARGAGLSRNCQEAKRLLEQALAAGDIEAVNKLEFFFGKAPSGGAVILKIEKNMSGKTNISSRGADSECGPAGDSGKVEINAGSATDFELNVSSQGASSGASKP
jgi:TPR repeat protein